MKQRFFYIPAAITAIVFLISCSKHTNYDAKGGDLPTNYISILDSSFSPISLTVVSGSSITFVNNTAVPQSIISEDSVTIRSTIVAPNSSFIFKKDTSGVFFYHLTNKPAARAVFVITP
jgi:hypothetical protein